MEWVRASLFHSTQCLNDRTITREATPGWGRGWTRAYDIRTGRHKWTSHTVSLGADGDSATWTGPSATTSRRCPTGTGGSPCASWWRISPGSATTAGENGQVNPDDGLAFARRTCAAAADAVDIVAGDRLRFEAGAAFRYSSYGRVLVSVLVEAVAGEPFADFMDREVFAPVGMSDTLLDARGGPPGPPRARRAGPGRPLFPPAFAMRTRYGVHDAPNMDHTCLMGADGFVSTPSDLARFGAALSRGDVLEPGTVELLQTAAQLASGEPTGYGLGWFVRRVPLDESEARVIDRPRRERRRRLERPSWPPRPRPRGPPCRRTSRSRTTRSARWRSRPRRRSPARNERDAFAVEPRPGAGCNLGLVSRVRGLPELRVARFAQDVAHGPLPSWQAYS